MIYRRRWDRRAAEVARHRRPKTGQALGASGPTADWPCTRSNPAESAALRLRSTGSRNVGTALGLSAPTTSRGRSREMCRTAGPRNGGMAQEANARGNARDRLTWATMVGMKGCKSESTRHEPGGNAEG